MMKPIIFTVDDEPQVLNAIERDLRKRFGGEYRIMKASTGTQAARTIRELKARGVPIALFLADQRMPGMEGTEFLAEAGAAYPSAKKVLLTAYADTRAAITSINKIGLDYYLMKPWDPPEKELYPVLEDLLDDWAASFRPPYDGIRVIGTLWSPRSHGVKDFLTRNQIPYQWLDAEKSTEAGVLLQTVYRDLPDHQKSDELLSRLPVILFPDGSHLIDPELRLLAESVGLRTRAALPFYDLIIIGGGPAGLAAAVYAGSEGLKTVLIEKDATGGQAGTSSLIENYLGFPRGLSGSDLARRATAQAIRFGVEIINQEVVNLRVGDPYRYIRLNDDTELSCHALLIATGVAVRTLGIPGAERLTGAGVYYGAAATEAINLRGSDVLVVGGANSAGQGALFLARYARKVSISVRAASLAEKMSRYLIDNIESTPNIEVLPGTTVTEVNGESSLESVVLTCMQDGGTRTLPVTAMFVYIGAAAHTSMLDGLTECDRAGFILTGPDLLRDGKPPTKWKLERDPYYLETAVPGIFAAGDVRHLSVKRVGSAVGEGAVAVALIMEYLKTV
jgi:thioredoxin reductase (NADPH)